MKRFLMLVLFILCCVVLISNPAVALTIDAGSIDVGIVDAIVPANSTTLGNSGNAEQDWIADVFDDPDAVEVFGTTSSDWTQVDNEAYIWAYELPVATTQFFLKVGTGGTDLESHIFYTNNISQLYAVVDLRDWGLLTTSGSWTGDNIPNNINIGRVSHVGAPVPEPSTIVLLGLGLVGAAGIGRKKFKL